MEQPHYGRISKLIDDFMSTHDSVLAGIITFPACSDKEFAIFQNSVLTALRRFAIKSAFYWILDLSTGERHYLLLVDKEHRINIDDILFLMDRLIERRDMEPLKFQDMYTLNKKTKDKDKEELMEVLDKCKFKSTSGFVAPSHCRKYGLSILKI